MEFIITAAFYEYNMLYKIGYVIISFFAKRLQFYLVFRGQELGCVSAGLGYNGIKDGVHQWDRVIGGCIVKLEKSCNPVEFMKVPLYSYILIYISLIRIGT